MGNVLSAAASYDDSPATGMEDLNPLLVGAGTPAGSSGSGLPPAGYYGGYGGGYAPMAYGGVSQPAIAAPPPPTYAALPAMATMSMPTQPPPMPAPVFGGGGGGGEGGATATYAPIEPATGWGNPGTNGAPASYSAPNSTATALNSQSGPGGTPGWTPEAQSEPGEEATTIGPEPPDTWAEGSSGSAQAIQSDQPQLVRLPGSLGSPDPDANGDNADYAITNPDGSVSYIYPNAGGPGEAGTPGEAGDVLEPGEGGDEGEGVSFGGEEPITYMAAYASAALPNTGWNVPGTTSYNVFDATQNGEMAGYTPQPFNLDTGLGAGMVEGYMDPTGETGWGDGGGGCGGGSWGESVGDEGGGGGCGG
jgi:hypothetical protein